MMKSNENQEFLYEVSLVTKNREILIDRKAVVAACVRDAEMEAGVYKVMQEKGLKARDVNIICINLANVNVDNEA